MQTANIMLALGGDTGNTIQKCAVTPAEIAILRAVHGEEAVFDVEPADDIERSSRAELERLAREYASSRLFGTDRRAVQALFPGLGARVQETLAELELPDEAYKSTARMTAPPVAKPVATPGKKGKASKAEQDDGMQDMTDKSAFE